MGKAAASLKSVEDVKKVAKILKDNRATNLFYSLWVMQYDTALRFSDATQLKWSDFSHSATHVSLKQKKTGKTIKVKITDTMRQIVSERLKEASSRDMFGEYVFSLSDKRSKGSPVSHNAVLEAFGKAGRRCGILEVGTHTPRKSKGRILFENGIQIERITKLLGQTSPAATLFYIGFTQEMSDDISEDFSLDL